MDDRARRVGRNEAVFRAVNEEIEARTIGLAEISDRQLHVVCECADLLCTKQLVVSVSDYEKVRADATCFLLVPGHERPDLEDVVEKTKRYNVVRKHAGEAARAAEESNPRS
jgi:hypothetical protein